MTGSHLTPDVIVDLLDGRGTEPARRHARECVHCQESLAEVRAVMDLAGTADVPEPSPLFWEHLSARVGRAVDAEPTAGPRGFVWGWRGWVSATAGMLALVVLGVAVGHRPAVPAGALSGSGLTAAVATSDGPTAVALPAPADDDGTWEVVTTLSAGLASDEGESAALEPAPGMAERAVAELSQEEQGELVRLLKAELARRPS